MLYRHSALAIAAAIVGSGVGAMSLPGAAEAQVYDDAAPRPFAYQYRDDAEFDSRRDWADRQADRRHGADRRHEADGGPRGPEAYPHRRPAGYDVSDGGPYGRPGPRHGYGERRWDRGDDHPGYGFSFDAPYGQGFPDRRYDVDPYEEVAAPVAPLADEEVRGPDVGCTVQRSETTTAAGWRKIVTHKTCYHR